MKVALFPNAFLKCLQQPRLNQAGTRVSRGRVLSPASHGVCQWKLASGKPILVLSPGTPAWHASTTVRSYSCPGLPHCPCVFLQQSSAGPSPLRGVPTSEPRLHCHSPDQGPTSLCSGCPCSTEQPESGVLPSPSLRLQCVTTGSLHLRCLMGDARQVSEHCGVHCWAQDGGRGSVEVKPDSKEAGSDWHSYCLPPPPLLMCVTPHSDLIHENGICKCFVLLAGWHFCVFCKPTV